MGKYDGVISDNNDENQIKFSLTDFHFKDNILHVIKNLKFILHSSQYSDKFTIKNDKLDIDKNKIDINPKSIISLDSSGSVNGTVIIDSNDKLKINYNSDFFTDFNSSLWVNIGIGLTRNSDNKITIASAKCNLKFVNNQLCLDMNAMINQFNSIKLDDKERLRLDYSANDFIKDSMGKLHLKIYEKHLKRTQHGIELNIDNDTIKYNTNESKLVSSMDKYIVPKYSTTGDIYVENNKLKLNINNYVDDNIGSKVVMNSQNKIDLDIVNHQAGEVYFDSNNHLTLCLGHYFTRDSSGHIIPIVNEDHGLNLNNYKLNLNVSAPIKFVNKKITLCYTPYFKLSSYNKLDIDITKLKTDIVISKQNEGIKLNSDGTLSLDRNVLTSFINVGSLSGLKIVSNQLIIDESLMGSNLIRLDSNSSLKRRANNFYEIVYDHVSIDADFVTGNLMVKPTYVPSIVTTDCIKNKVINE